VAGTVGGVTDWQHVRVEDRGVTTRITLDRPDRRNALSEELMVELQAALEGATAPIVVLAGAGPAFSAGHDLEELAASEGDALANVFDRCTALMATVRSIPQPVIARVHGVASAAGCQLVATCDLAVAESGARFATPGVRIGLFCSTPMVPLTRAVGPKRAMHMLLTGDTIDAQTALAWGLVNEVVAPDELDAAIDALADRIASYSPEVIALGKRTFYEQVDLPSGDAYSIATKVMAENAALDDAAEGISAFLEKRSPTWTGEPRG